MKALRQQWDRLNARYAALTQRERGLVAAALVFAPLLIGYSLFVDPQLTKAKGLESGVARQSASVSELQAQVGSLQQQLQNDPDAPQKAELATLKSERDGLDKQIQQFGASLVRPEDMNGLLEGLLARHNGLRLVSLKTLAPQSVLREVPADAAKPGDGKPVERVFDLYRHGVEIRLEGHFGELQAYLAQLEKLPQRLLWGSLSYRVIDHPRAELTLTVYTLSPERTWLAL
jgi:MSHA biogenesis protein MshJ